MVDQEIPQMPGIEIIDEELPDAADIDAPDGHIHLEGLANTRDLGGIETADGRRVKPHRLLRSGALEKATQHDANALVDEYRVRTVIDFRTEEERLKKPDPEHLFEGVEFVDIPILNTQALGITREGGIKGLLDAVKAIESDPADLMIQVYPSMVLNEQSVQGFSEFFDTLYRASDDEDAAVLWHCSAGKDRAGLATVFVLHVLGVSHERILADYLATNAHMETRTEEILDSLAAYGMAGRLDQGVRVLNSADERFLQAALDAVDEHYGDLDTFIRDELGVTPERAEALRERYLEPIQQVPVTD